MDTKRIILTGLLGASFALSNQSLFAQERAPKAHTQKIVIKQHATGNQAEMLKKASLLSAKASALAAQGKHEEAAKYAMKASKLLQSSFQTSAKTITGTVVPTPPRPPMPPKAPQGRTNTYFQAKVHAGHAAKDAKAAYEDAMRSHGGYLKLEGKLHENLLGLNVVIEEGELDQLHEHMLQLNGSNDLKILEALGSLGELGGLEGLVELSELEGLRKVKVFSEFIGQNGHPEFNDFTLSDDFKGAIKIELRMEGDDKSNGVWEITPGSAGKGEHMIFKGLPSGKHGAWIQKNELLPPDVQFFGGNDQEHAAIRILGLPQAGNGKGTIELLLDSDGNHLFGHPEKHDGKVLRKVIVGQPGETIRLHGETDLWVEKSCDSDSAPEYKTEVKVKRLPRAKKAATSNDSARELINQMQKEMQSLRNDIAELRRSMGDDPLVQAYVKKHQQSEAQPVYNRTGTH